MGHAPFVLWPSPFAERTSSTIESVSCYARDQPRSRHTKTLHQFMRLSVHAPSTDPTYTSSLHTPGSLQLRPLKRPHTTLARCFPSCQAAAVNRPAANCMMPQSAAMLMLHSHASISPGYLVQPCLTSRLRMLHWVSAAPILTLIHSSYKPI